MEKSFVNNKLTKLPVPIKGIILYVIMFTLYTLFACTGFYLEENKIQLITGIIVAICLAGIIYYRYAKKIIGEDLALIAIEFVMIAGIVMRIGCMLYSDFRIIAYDMGELQFNTEINDYEYAYFITGHGGYIVCLLQGILPQTNLYQFYQQPLFYLLGAGTSFLSNLIVSYFRSDVYFLIAPAKIISCLASCLSIYVVKSLFDKFKMSNASKLYGITFFAFFPGLLTICTKVTSDALTAFFIALTLLLTINWYEDHSWKNTILLALAYGFAVMTKISGALMAPLTVIVFLYVLIKKNIGFKDAVLKYLSFLVISLPLGLWYNVRNLIRFNQPLGYIYPQDPANDLYTGDRSLFDRLVPSAYELLKSPSAEQYDDCNFFVYFLKTSMYSTLRLYTLLENMLGVLLLALGIILSGFIVASIVKIIFSKDKNLYEIVLCFIEIGCFAFSIYFYISEPFSCSMEFRYMAFIIVPSALLLGLFHEKFSSRKLKDAEELSIILFGISSIAFYLLARFT